MSAATSEPPSPTRWLSRQCEGEAGTSRRSAWWEEPANRSPSSGGSQSPSVNLDNGSEKVRGNGSQATFSGTVSRSPAPDRFSSAGATGANWLKDERAGKPHDGPTALSHRCSVGVRCPLEGATSYCMHTAVWSTCDALPCGITTGAAPCAGESSVR